MSPCLVNICRKLNLRFCLANRSTSIIRFSRLTGSFFIEKVYAIPGFGRYFIEAVQTRDLSIVLGQTVLMAAVYVLVVFLVDILYTLVDPRIRVGGKA